MTVLYLTLGLGAIAAAWVIWTRLTDRGHPIIGALAGGATHAVLTLTAVWLWIATGN